MAVAKKLLVSSLAAAGVAAAFLLVSGVFSNGTVGAFSSGDRVVRLGPMQARAARLVLAGRNVFRYDTFGDQAVWGGVLGLQKAVEGAKFGGVGPGVSPKLALALG